MNLVSSLAEVVPAGAAHATAVPRAGLVMGLSSRPLALFDTPSRGVFLLRCGKNYRLRVV